MERDRPLRGHDSAVRQGGGRDGDPRPVQAALRPAVGRLPDHRATEALVSIDVELGALRRQEGSREDDLKTNLEAAREIARQLRLRDVGGIIVCDFIDMDTKSNREKVLRSCARISARPRTHARPSPCPTRPHRDDAPARAAEPSAEHDRVVPTCAGTGRVFTAETILRRMERSVKRMASREARPVAGELHRRRDVRDGERPDLDAEAREDRRVRARAARRSAASSGRVELVVKSAAAT